MRHNFWYHILMRDLTIAVIKKAAPAILSQVNQLAAGMSLSATPPLPLTPAQLRELIAQKNVFLLGAHSGTEKNKNLGSPHPGRLVPWLRQQYQKSHVERRDQGPRDALEIPL